MITAAALSGAFASTAGCAPSPPGLGGNSGSGGSSSSAVGGGSSHGCDDAPTPQHVWSKLFGGSAYVDGIATDASDNVALAGALYDSVDFGGGELESVRTDTFVAKLDSSGSHLWSHSFGVANPSDPQLGGNIATASAVAMDDAGNVVITGHSESSIDFGGGESENWGGVFVVKFDADGQHQWSVVNGSGQAHGLGIDGAGNIYLAGTVYGGIASSANFGGGELAGGGGEDVFVVKLDGNGNHVWSKRFGGKSDQTASALAVDPSGNVVITGQPGDDLDFGGGVLDKETATSTGYAAKFSADGDHVWSTQLANALSGPNDIAIDGSGNVLITGGTFAATTFVTKLDENGATVWTEHWGNLYQSGYGVAADALGNILVTGRADGTIDFGDGCGRKTADVDAFVALFEPDGAVVFSQVFGDDEVQRGTAVAFDSSGNALVAGTAKGSVDFGGGPLSASDEEIFVAKFE